MLLVIAFHAGITQFAGGFVGVDVFFVISGFLITGILLKETTSTGTISLRNFYPRRIRRLLPLSALVLVVTVAIGILLVPALDRSTLLGDARSAAMYVSNWRFAGQATAYADTTPANSLFVHYWSLSIEEQFYVLWPLIILLTSKRVMRIAPSKLPRALGSVLAVLAVGSFGLSILLTKVQGTSAYYGTHLRLGELATGAALAVAARRLGRFRGRLADLASIAGIVLIIAAAMMYTRNTPYPGSAVLLPVLGSALILASGIARPAAVGRILSRPPLPAIGRISYAWYLWHWPALGLTSLALGGGASASVQTAGKVFAVVVSLLLAIASHLIVENPVRFSKRLRLSAAKGLALGVGLTAISLVATMLPATGSASTSIHVAGSIGMTPEEARGSTVKTMGDCHALFHETAAPAGCVFGDRRGDKTIALVGDSIAQQWFPALERAARAHHWRLLSWVKDACPMTDVHTFYGRLNRPYRECVAWRENVFDRIETARGGVNLIVVGRMTYSGKNVLSDDDTKRTRPLAAVWEDASERTFVRLRRTADRVLAVRDTPLAPVDIPGCLSDSPNAPARCEFSRGDHANRDGIITAAERAAAPDGVEVIDLTHLVCPADPCPVVTAEGLIIYRDRHHMTARFSATLADVMADLVRPLLA